MPIIEPVIRPPAEHASFLLQVTTGCSTNSCTFCGAYQHKPFRIKSLSEIFSDIKIHANHYPQTRKVFLMDGNALVLSNAKLIPILEKLNHSFPKLTRISSYANGSDIMRKPYAELQALSHLKLKLIYLGLESGSQAILNICHKKSTVTQMIDAVHIARQASIKSSVILLLGLGGKKYSSMHVAQSIPALNQMQPRLLSFLSLMLIPGTPLFKQKTQNLFTELSSLELLEEAHNILSGLELKQTIFRCNHASNYLPLEGRLPQDKPVLLAQLKQALQGKKYLKPEFFRGL
jgi:radical SAM superfamily enzyme YgiQ (UPF0313 family)